MNKFLLWGYKVFDIKSTKIRCKSHWKSCNLSLASTFSSFLPWAPADEELWQPWCAVWAPTRSLAVPWISHPNNKTWPTFGYYLMLMKIEYCIQIEMLKAYPGPGQKLRAQAVLAWLSDNWGNWPNFCEWSRGPGFCSGIIYYYVIIHKRIVGKAFEASLGTSEQINK